MISREALYIIKTWRSVVYQAYREELENRPEEKKTVVATEIAEGAGITLKTLYVIIAEAPEFEKKSKL